LRGAGICASIATIPNGLDPARTGGQPLAPSIAMIPPLQAMALGRCPSIFTFACNRSGRDEAVESPRRSRGSSAQ
jgi:hypothetical protein